MKKRAILSLERLEKLTTKRLLAYRNSLLKCWEGRLLEVLGGGVTLDMYPNELCKSDKEWKESYKQVKTVLATREHVERKLKHKKH